MTRILDALGVATAIQWSGKHIKIKVKKAWGNKNKVFKNAVRG